VKVWFLVMCYLYSVTVFCVCKQYTYSFVLSEIKPARARQPSWHRLATGEHVVSCPMPVPLTVPLVFRFLLMALALGIDLWLWLVLQPHL
jgi:hypothetical protein